MKRNKQSLEAALGEIDRRHLRRHRRTVESHSSSSVVVDGRELVNFCSNDYLGLAQHPAIANAMAQAASVHGAGSGASHLVTGHGIEHAKLEEDLAAFTGRERALLFSTGYMANLAAVTAFAERGDTVLLDRLNHASLIDAGLLSGARFKRYAHSDVSALKDALRDETRSALVATDGVFSMDGDVAPLPDLAAAASEHEAWLVVDDAHGLGVLGSSGRGTLEHFGLSAREVPLLVGTFGKALGTFGAFIAGDNDVIELLMQRARTYIFTTALPQPVAAATRAALALMQKESWRREKVLALTQRFRSAAQQLSITLADSNTPIQPVIIGTAEAALAVSKALLDAGFWVAAIRPPTVPPGTARLRITFSADHTESQVDALVDALSSVTR